jgi:uncharacterized protein YegP (UPF0339 family)
VAPEPAALHYYRDGTEQPSADTQRMITAKFEVYKDSAGEFRFRLKASNGQVIATGESYKTKAGVLNGIDSIKRNAADAAIIDLSS